MIAHTTLPVRDYAKSKAFYMRVLALGYSQNMEHGEAVSSNDGKNTDFWISAEKSVVPTHVAFQAADRKQVEAFHKSGRDGRRQIMGIRVTVTTPRATSRLSLSTQTVTTLRLYGTTPPGRPENGAGCLSCLEFGRQRGLFIRIDEHFENGSAGGVQHGPDGGSHFGRVSTAKAIGAAGFRECDEIDRGQLASIGGIAEFFLFEQHLGQAVVLENDDLDGQLVLHGRDEINQELRESAIPHDGHRLAIRKSQLLCDCEGEGARAPWSQACPCRSAVAFP